MVQGAVEKAIALTNPRLKLLPDCYKRLTPAVETTIEFLCAQVAALPAAHTLSAKAWSSDPALRAFFVAPTDIQTVLGRSDNLRTLFEKVPELDEAFLVLGMALNELFIPLLQRQFPEIIDFYLPPEGCSYRMALVRIRKAYPGHPRRVMMGVWSHLRQFMYTKFIVVVDDDVNVRDWKEVIWALSTRVDPVRDTMMVENTPIDYLDFASPVSGLGSKMGLDATNKWPGETQREWGRTIATDAKVP